MKTSLKKLFVAVLTTGAVLTLAGQASAQTFSLLHNFTNSPEGANPRTGLTVSGNKLYGTTIQGGSSGAGTVFSLNEDGTGFTNLISFSAVVPSPIGYTNSGGAYPSGVLLLSSNKLYGEAQYGPRAGGVIYAVNTDGTAFTNLYAFPPLTSNTNSDGESPNDRLILTGNTLYGLAIYGGSFGAGTMFRLNIDGTGFTNLYNFTGGNDGANPGDGLVLAGNMFYGTAIFGGRWNSGTVFGITTNGTGLTVEYTFSTETYSGNQDGSNPEAHMVMLGNTLYGTTEYGGSKDDGTVFRVNTGSGGFTNLLIFTNSNGASPFGGLVLYGNTLYGVTLSGGAAGSGTVFAINTDGTGFTVLHSFSALSHSTNSDGANPYEDLVVVSNKLYGTASAGGPSGHGTVFAITLPPPQLGITSSGTYVTLTWPTNAVGFKLQSTTNLALPAAWSDVSSASTVVNMQNTVTNMINSQQMFYRLNQ